MEIFKLSSLFEFQFMRNAFFAILIITPMFGMLGTMVVNQKMAFFSESLGHSALTGIAIGVILGIGNTNLSMIIFAVGFALLLNYISSRNLSSKDTIISVFSSGSMALGLAILSRGGTFTQYSSLLIGDVLSIAQKEVGYLIILFVFTFIFWCFSFNFLNAISIHKSLAKSQGISVVVMENLFSVLLALVVMLSIQWIGILLINALLILPAASSRNISINMREYHFFSVLFSLFSGILGLLVSYYTNVATGPMIVIIGAIIFFATYLYKQNSRNES